MSSLFFPLSSSSTFSSLFHSVLLFFLLIRPKNPSPLLFLISLLGQISSYPKYCLPISCPSSSLPTLVIYSFINSPFIIQSDQPGNAGLSGQITPVPASQSNPIQPPTSLNKQVGGYMRPDNLQLSCLQPPTSSINLQLPHDHHGCPSRNDCHGRQ